MVDVGLGFDRRSALDNEEWSALGWTSIGDRRWAVRSGRRWALEQRTEVGLIKMEDWKRKKEEERRDTGERERKRKRKKYFFNKRGERNLIK